MDPLRQSPQQQTYERFVGPLDQVITQVLDA